MSEQFRFEQYDALIFDMDGTLVDSMPRHLDAWEATSAEFGLPFDRAQLNEYGGIPTRKIVAILAEQHGLTIDVEAFTRRKVALYMEHIQQVSVFPAMWELVRRCHGKVPMGIGTGSPRNQAESILKSTGLDAYIQVVVSADDVVNHKPTPTPSCKWPSSWGPTPPTAWCSKTPRSACRRAAPPEWRRYWCWRGSSTSARLHNPRCHQ